MEYEGKFFQAMQQLAMRSESWTDLNAAFARAAGMMSQHSDTMDDCERLISAMGRRDDYDYTEMERMREEGIKAQRAYRRANREYLAAQYLMSQQFDGQLNAQPFDRGELLRHIAHMHEQITGDWEDEGGNRSSRRFETPQDAGLASLLLDCVRQAYGGETGHYLRKEPDNTLVISSRAFRRSFEKEFGISLGSGEDWRRSL